MITSVIFKEQVIELKKNNNTLTGTISMNKNGWGTFIAFDLNKKTGYPYSAHTYNHRGGNAIKTTGHKSINLAKLSFIMDGESVTFSNSGKLK